MTYYLSICAVMKNEGPYLQEWLEYHKMVGVEHFFLYDNGSTDETDSVLAPYIRNKDVTYHNWPTHPIQLKAYMHCLRSYKKASFWIAFIDLDEFIVPVVNDTVSSLLHDFEQFGGLGINWVLYGTSGHRAKPQGLQIENYLYRAPDTWHSHAHIKTILNPRKTRSPKDPHSFRYCPDTYAVDENGKKISGSLTKHISISKIRINHYFTRSIEESRKKWERGNPDSKYKRPWSDFERLNKNDVYDASMLKFIPHLKKNCR